MRGQEHAHGSGHKACRKRCVTNLSAAGTEVLVVVAVLRISPPLLHLHKQAALVADNQRPVMADCALVEQQRRRRFKTDLRHRVVNLRWPIPLI